MNKKILHTKRKHQLFCLVVIRQQFSRICWPAHRIASTCGAGQLMSCTKRQQHQKMTHQASDSSIVALLCKTKRTRQNESFCCRCCCKRRVHKFLMTYFQCWFAERINWLSLLHTARRKLEDGLPIPEACSRHLSRNARTNRENLLSNFHRQIFRT